MLHHTQGSSLQGKGTFVHCPWASPKQPYAAGQALWCCLELCQLNGPGCPSPRTARSRFHPPPQVGLPKGQCLWADIDIPYSMFATAMGWWKQFVLAQGCNRITPQVRCWVRTCTYERAHPAQLILNSMVLVLAVVWINGLLLLLCLVSPSIHGSSPKEPSIIMVLWETGRSNCYLLTCKLLESTRPCRSHSQLAIWGSCYALLLV